MLYNNAFTLLLVLCSMIPCAQIVLDLPSRHSRGHALNDVLKKFDFFDPLPPLSAFGTDMQYRDEI